MTPGDLRDRISIENRTESSDGHDGHDETWTAVRRRIHAQVVRLAGHDLVSAQQIDPRISHEVTVRFYRDYPDDFDGGRARVVFHDEGGAGDRTLDIITPPIETVRRRTLVIQCREAA